MSGRMENWEFFSKFVIVKKLIYILMACLLPVLSVGGNFTARTKLALSGVAWQGTHDAPRQGLRKAVGQGCGLVTAMVKGDAAAIARLRQSGVRVQAQFDSIATIQVPATALAGLAAMPGVRAIALAQHMRLCNDSARYYSHVDSAQQGMGFAMPYTGRGVVVGMIDVGFDFNHISFLDSAGRSRFVRVYMPADTTGTSPIIAGDTLPGSDYVTPQAIAQLTTDAPGVHGTHTTATAAGSYLGNRYSGVAPDAQLVACAMPDSALTDVNIANSLRYIFNYAASVGRPAVVNMSLSGADGAHDGSSLLCQVMENVSGSGKICVLSAGNDGNVPICLHKSFTTAADTLGTLLGNKYGGRNVQGYVSMWSGDSAAHAVRVVVTDVTTGAVRYASPFYSLLPSADSIAQVTSETDTAFARYFTGYVAMASAVEDNGKFHSIVAYQARYVDWNCVLGLQYVAAPGEQLMGWSDSYTRMQNFGVAGYTAGDCSMTISDLATGDSSISVGSYTTRALAPVLSGSNAAVSGGTVGDISTFSSFGPDARGIMRPEVVAPGQCLVSAYSRYDSTMAVSDKWLTAVATVNGVDYPYGVDVGTSMSAPMVTGAIALMLQANPRLGVADVKRILQHSARCDQWVTQGDASRWGYGKLDVGAALRYMQGGYSYGDVNGDGLVNVTDVACLAALIAGAAADASYSSRADLNADGVLNVTDVTALVNLIMGLPLVF